jgi:hypothetical protein
MAFAAMLMTDYLIGRRPFMPGLISAIFMALWIFLRRRYGPRPRRPVDPRRQRIWFLSGIAASAALGGLGLIAAVWIGGTYSEPSATCRALSRTNPVPPNDDLSTKVLALSPANKDKIGWRSAPSIPGTTSSRSTVLRCVP